MKNLNQKEFNKFAEIRRFLDDFVLVEGGEFTMGDIKFQNAPPHKVVVNSFYMQSSTVTYEFWEMVMENKTSSDKSFKHKPVTDVSWYDCQDFIKKLNSISGKTYRLPEEAEWEYAARGGNLSKGFKYAGSDNIEEVAWYKNNSNEKLNTVKKKNSNELGIFDMSGNVLEWCNDWYDDYQVNINNSKNPLESDNRLTKVMRGGCWSYHALNCQVAYREDMLPEGSVGSKGGFRLVLPVE